LNATMETRVKVMESEVAMLHEESVGSRTTSATIMAVLDDLRTVTYELRKCQEELGKGQDELRSETRACHDELRAEMHAGHTELREEISTIKRSVGNLEVSVNDPLLREGA
jgi:hypothetical protein